MKNNNAKLKIITAAMIIGLGVAGRFVLVSYAGIPNFEIITALALISGIYLGWFYAAAVPLSIIFLSDIVIGNNYIFIFTWTAFAFIGFAGFVLKNKIKNKMLSNSVLLAVVSSVFFYLYTNFGWWLISGMYEYNFSGLIKCYWMAIPFFRNNLIGNLIFVPAGIYIFSKILERKAKLSDIKISIIYNNK